METKPFEIRGRGNRWKVFYPAEDSLASPVPVFDKDGVYKETLMCAGPSGGMTECHFEGTYEEAEEYARWLNPTREIKKVRLRGSGQHATSSQNGHKEAQENMEPKKEGNPFWALERKREVEPAPPAPPAKTLHPPIEDRVADQTPKQNPCRSCGKEIEPTGKRGRPPVRCEECR